IFRVVAAKQGMHDKPADHVIAAYNDRPENRFRKIRGDAENIRQIDVHFVDQPIVIPRLPWPKPLPTWAANECADDNHRYPKNDEAKQKCTNGKLTLLPRVVPAA